MGSHLAVTACSQRTHPRRHCLLVPIVTRFTFGGKTSSLGGEIQSPKSPKPRTTHPTLDAFLYVTTNAGQSHPLHGPSNSSYLFLGGFGAGAQKHLPLSYDQSPQPHVLHSYTGISVGNPCAINTLTTPSTAS